MTMVMTETQHAQEILIRAHRIGRRYCGSDTAKSNELVNDIMDLLVFDREDETVPDTPPPGSTPPPDSVPPLDT